MAQNIQNPLFPLPAYDSAGAAIADQRLTVDSTAGGVQFSAFNAITQVVVLDIQGADIMVTFDGSAPTTTNGHRLYDGDHYTWSKATATAAKMIRQAGVSASVQASEFQV
tara:strand:- start:475 stop:804 length:330 start_codon:yes stop_codon:yes gene_type:complete